MAKFSVSERLACQVIGQHRSTPKEAGGRKDDEALTADIVRLAFRYSRYGYRRSASNAFGGRSMFRREVHNQKAALHGQAIGAKSGLLSFHSLVMIPRPLCSLQPWLESSKFAAVRAPLCFEQDVRQFIKHISPDSYQFLQIPGTVSSLCAIPAGNIVVRRMPQNAMSRTLRNNQIIELVGHPVARAI